MTSFVDRLPPGFLIHILAGMALNLEIAGIALAVGLALGIPLAFARLRGRLIGAVSAGVVALMRAAPTFVVMFFLLNVIPPHMSLFGVRFSLSGVMIVALSLVPYSAYYVAESGVEAIRQLRRRSPLTALLFLPNIARSFFVLVMASSAGAAIGVRESITTILRQAERLPSRGDQFGLFAIGILLFGVTLQTGFAVVNLIRRQLAHVAVRRMAIPRD